ncbi:MAG: PBP1A family penicillin-binding protein [Chloroflexota bacterium]|nr:PBP1A family penicillin-binding protein [Chloroflexota bacterium]
MRSSLKAILMRRRRRRSNSNSRGPAHIGLQLALGTLGFITLSVLLAILIAFGTVAGVYAHFAQGLPDPSAIETAQETFETTKIYDRTGQHLLYEIFDPRRGDRTIVPLEGIPLHLRQATIAIEDRNFYENPGINPEGIFRAFVNNLLGRPVQGGSSITQQLVKNVLIPPEERYKKLYSRKIKEAILALEISRRYPGREGKDQILEWYLNYNFYGNFAYGVEAASQIYFGKHVQDLELAECAMLAALPQFPALNPINAPEEAQKRQHLVLDAMLRQGYITAEQAVAAKVQPLEVQSSLGQRFDIRAPHFSLYVQKFLEQELGQRAYQGLKIYTTLDLDLQRRAEEIAREHVNKLQEGEHNVSNAAVVAIRPNTGEILAMMGSLDYWDESIDGNVNMALANRQPGSAFKPFTYVTALSQGYTPATMIMDVRTGFYGGPRNPWYVPENYDRRYHGPQRLRLALARSYNMPAVWMLSKVGVKNVINTAHRMGVNTLNADYYGLSLTLGGGEVRPLDMTYAFSVFANGGVMAGQPISEDRRHPGFRELDPVAILRIEDSQGRVIKQYLHPETRQVLSPQLAFLMNDILSDNQARLAVFGSGNKLHLEDRPAAAKTGTTDDWRDAWTIGYTPQLAVGVWTGNSDNEPMKDVPGSRGAAPIWQGVMKYALKDEPVQEFARPPGIVEAEVCAVSGLLPTEHCPHTVTELFLEGTAPTAHCDVHQVFRVNKETGKLASVHTPPELVEERVYEIFPPEAQDWVRENEIPQPPSEYDEYGPGQVAGDVAILDPAPYAYLREGQLISGNAKGGDFRAWRLEYGPGLNPSSWSPIGGEHGHQVDHGPLEFWDVSKLEGLYTLRLTVMHHNRPPDQAAIQVTVDHTPPSLQLIYPPDEKEYVMEEDEYVNIQAKAEDNVSMDRVEFYLDGELLKTSTVPPYTARWTIIMKDTPPVEGPPVEATRVITHPDGTTSEETYIARRFERDPDTGAPMWIFDGGKVITIREDKYTEIHEIHTVAYDAAGNKQESEKIHIPVVHEEEE